MGHGTGHPRLTLMIHAWAAILGPGLWIFNIGFWKQTGHLTPKPRQFFVNSKAPRDSWLAL
jgi:hypothetical protein